MWAATKLSFTSAVCVPVKSMLNTVAEKIRAVCASFRMKDAMPKNAGLEPPVVVVGITGGFSREFVRVAVNKVSAWAGGLTKRTVRLARRIISPRCPKKNFLVFTVSPPFSC